MDATDKAEARSELRRRLRALFDGVPDLGSDSKPADTFGDRILLAEAQVPEAVLLSYSEGNDAGIAMLDDIGHKFEMWNPAEIDPFIAWGRANYHAILLAGSPDSSGATEQIDLAMRIARRNRKPGWEALSLLTLARYQMSQGEVLDCALTLAKVVQQPDMPGLAAMANTLLADLFESFGQDNHSAVYRKRVFSGAEAAEIPISCYAALMLSHLERGDIEAATVTQAQVNQHLATIKAKSFASVGRHLDALLLCRLERPQEALDSLSPDLYKLAEGGHFVVNLCVPLVWAEIYQALGRWAECREVLERALANGSSPAREERMQRAIAQVCIYEGDWAGAVSHQERQLAIRQRCEASSQQLHRLHRRSAVVEEMRSRNAQLVLTKKELEVLRLDFDSVLDIVSHDVASPLAALSLILGHLEAGGTGPGGVPQFESQVGLTLARLQGIIDQLSSLGDAFDGSGSDSSEMVSLAQVVDLVMSEVTFLAADKHVEIAVGPVDDILAVPAGTGTIMSHILQNLVSNAIKFSDARGTVTVEVQTDEGRRSDDNFVSLVIQDQGPGFDELEAERLFTRYAKLSARPTAGESSTGLGLFLSKRMADSTGLELSAYSAGIGKGATFTLRIPTAVLTEAGLQAGLA